MWFGPRAHFGGLSEQLAFVSVTVSATPLYLTAQTCPTNILQAAFHRIVFRMARGPGE